MKRSAHNVPRARPGSRGRWSRAFTLIEVILAISLAVGLLVVALWFYRQASVYRDALLLEAERLSAIRLLNDRMAGDLRTLLVDGRHAFTGDSNSVRFAHAVVVTTVEGELPESDLRLVAYRAVVDSQASNSVVRGITRAEEPLIDTLPEVGTRPVTTVRGTPELELQRPVETPTIETLHYLAFRYWDGSQWRDSWNSFAPPAGVELTVAIEAPHPEEGTNGMPAEVFRRVLEVPAGMRALRSTRPRGGESAAAL